MPLKYVCKVKEQSRKLWEQTVDDVAVEWERGDMNELGNPYTWIQVLS